MAPVATETVHAPDVASPSKQSAKADGKVEDTAAAFNPFYSYYAPTDDEEDDRIYAYSKYKPFFPEVDWQPLGPLEVKDRGHFADPEKRSLLSAATKVKHLTPAIGVEIHGIDLRNLTDAQKDELALLAAERTVVVFRNQAITIEEQLELGRYFGPLHKHATTPVPRQPGLEEVHVVYSDSSRRPDPTAFAKVELWHSDVTYELQPPCLTSLQVITSPEVGGDTLWSSGYALYSSLSADMQAYLEKQYALHSAVAQAQGSRAAGTHVRRKEIETIHPVVRVHPVTGWKSVFVNPGFTRRLLNVPKAESDAVLRFLFHQIAENPDFQVRINWESNDIVYWDNRVCTHSATFDFYPERRHALRVTPHGERPMSVAEYEQGGKKAKDRQVEIWKLQGIEVPKPVSPIDGIVKQKVYND
ncbi:alpha-ketoglutarate-dependent sulfonate dioxygenase [Calocera viscosa TUFC12733]|uniref:Alpha-ketoglutarate-dependent sulfonate dioxygenase n=1 Tax=Calocera viscosa (strain TUFC12733) TaxID=1330018 RepID=A0A167QX04_CALVF|nr:alpha-ketoglutarate-dependent sulfonate dioxygenase [Calocera viscosa TUFC12733]